MQENKFDVPSGYEDFVTGADELLKQFQEVGVPDRCRYSIYLDKDSSVAEALGLRNQILHSCALLSSQYLWHKQSLNLTVSVHERTGMVFLHGYTEYAENVEDEWYIVYLLMNVSKQYSNFIISVFDSSDGQFLLIEAADYLDDWISPDNVENRVWIRHGHIYVIPQDEPGKLKNGGLPLVNALEFFHSGNTSNIHRAKLSSAAHRAIAARTSAVYPTRIKALEHRVVCIMPRWAATVFALYPQLLSHAVSAFSTCDSFTQPAKTARRSNSNNGASSGASAKNNHEAAIITITLTRALFAQLTFKPNFKPPRQYHALMRRVTNAGSIKVRKAFDIGCRLVCGLEELCVGSAQVAIAAHACADETALTAAKEIDNIQSALQRKTAESIDSLSSLYHKHLLTLYYDESNELDPEIQEYQHMMHVQSLFQVPLKNSTPADRQREFIHVTVNSIVAQLPLMQDVEGVSSLRDNAAIDSDSVEGTKIDREFFSVIANDTLKSDSDAWLYMSPEEMDAEMTNRMKEFAVASDDKCEDESEMVTDSPPVASTTENENDMDVTNAANNMQDIVDGVKKFLKGKSDFEGISPRQPAVVLSSTADAAPSAPLETQNNTGTAVPETNQKGLVLDSNYLQQLLAQNSLDKAQAMSSSQMDIAENISSSKPSEAKKKPSGAGNKERSSSGITMEQIDFHYNEELHRLQQYFNREDLEQFSSDDEGSDPEEDDGDDYSGVGSSDSEGDDDDDDDDVGDADRRRRTEGVFMNPTTVTGVAKATIGSKVRGGEMEESDSEMDSDDEDPQDRNISSGRNFNKRKVNAYENDDNEGSEDDMDEDMTDADYQALMDMELYGQAAMAETFERKPAPPGADDGGLGEVDVDLNLLKNLLESHSQGLGHPVGPASQLLAQFGVQMPRPPPMRDSEGPTGGESEKRNKKSGSHKSN